MKRFLSIDWDYFIKATYDQRCTLFPDGGNENLPDNIRNYIWDKMYSNPDLKEIEVIDEYSTLISLCNLYRGNCLVTDSHKHIYDLIVGCTGSNEEFEIYNIDFHHDMYHFRTKGDRVNCGNWGTVLSEERPNMKMKWVGREDSATEVIGGDEVDVEKITMQDVIEVFQKEGFDYLFMCRSALWSPPHLDYWFIRAVETLMHHCLVEYEEGILRERAFGAD